MFKVNKKHLIFIVLVFFIFANKASANLEISEVNYNPTVKTNHLWIKVFNNSDGDIDLTSWSVADYDGDSWHYHAINADNSSILNSKSYAIIAKASATSINDFKAKNPDITENLFYGNLTIEDKGLLGLSNDKKTIISQKSYGDSSDSTSDTIVTNTDNDTNSSTSSSSKSTTKIYKTTTKIISPKIVVAGVPFLIDHETTGTKNEKVVIGKFIWNFGDGMVKQLATSDQFSYTYKYPGDYVFTLSFYNSILDTSPSATDRINIKVIPSGLNITSVGNSSDPFIEIENNSNYEMSIHNFVVKGSHHSFIIPEGMVILPGKKIKLSSQITGFDFNDLDNIRISDSFGLIFATYPKKKYFSPEVYSSSKNLDKGSVKSDTNNKLENEQEIINLNDLGANVIKSNSLKNINNNYYAWFGLIFVIVVGMVSVIFIRRKKYYPDYIDDEIDVKDIKIIE